LFIRDRGEHYLKKRKIGLGVIIAILLVILAGFGGLVTFITDFLWFKELGYTSVFFKQLFTQLQIGIPTFVVIMILTYFYLRVLKRGYYKRIDTVDTPAVSEKALNRITLGLSAVFGLLLTISTVLGLWFQILKLQTALPLESRIRSSTWTYPSIFSDWSSSPN